MALCPVHGDRNEPNLSIDVTKNWFDRLAVQFRCFRCGANGDAVLEALGLSEHSQVIYHRGKEEFAWQPPKYAASLPSWAQLDEWREALWASDEHWRFVVETRGVDPRIARRFRVGWDDSRKRFTLPVADEAGDLVNVRFYAPDPPADRGKTENLPGHGTPPRLYPSPPPSDATKVVVAEGEWDVLVARSHGLTAVCGTHGADTWLPEWSGALAGKHVRFVYDCDEAGRDGAAAAAESVRRFAKSVGIVDLGLGDKEDLSDWFVKYSRSLDELRPLLNAKGVAGGGARGGQRA
jgi:DNA primase